MCPGTTPQGLIDEGIFKEIATALHKPPHRAVSLALLAQALGATKASMLAKAKQRSRRSLISNYIKKMGSSATVKTAQTVEAEVAVL